MNIVTALTQWNAQRQPQIALDYSLEQCSDITAQDQINVPSTPNLYTVEIVCDDATLALIDADTNYYVLTSEAIVDA